MAVSNNTAEGSGARSQKTSLIGLIVEILAVSVIAGGAGAAMAFLQGAPPPIQPAAAAPEKASATPERTLVDLPPIITNIASPPDLWVRVEASVVIDGKAAASNDVLAAEIATDALAYLRTLTIGQIEGPIGLQNIRQDLADRAVVRSKGAVTELILKTLVLQ